MPQVEPHRPHHPQGPARYPDAPPTYDPSSGYPTPPPAPPTPQRPSERPRGDGGRLRVPYLVAAVLAVGLAVTLVALVVARSSDNRGNDLAGAAPGGLDVGAVLAKAQPSVVTVWVRTPEALTTGTGVVMSPDGLVLTNAHVVGVSSTATVTLSDGRELEADLLGSLPGDDVALLSARGVTDLVPAELGSSADAEVGDEVVAIGNALGLGGLPSVTSGIISAKDRTIQTSSVVLRDLIQTDAAINQGNSGGPLMDALGRVIGINTAIAAQAQNIGFAIPIDNIKPLVEDLRSGEGVVTPGSAFLGVQTVPVESLSPQDLTSLGITATSGAVIVSVIPNSAAEAAGLEVGDVVVSVDGTPVLSSGDLSDRILSLEPGDEINLVYERDGTRQSVDVQLRRRDQSGRG